MLRVGQKAHLIFIKLESVIIIKIPYSGPWNVYQNKFLLSINCFFPKLTLTSSFFSDKNIVSPVRAEYAYFTANFRIKIFL